MALSDAFIGGVTAGRQAGGRYSGIGEALNKLLSMGFQVGQQEREQTFRAGEAEKDRAGALQRVVTTTGMEIQGRSMLEEQKQQQAKEAIKTFTKLVGDARAAGSPYERAVLETRISELDQDANGIPDAVEAGTPTAPQPGAGEPGQSQLMRGVSGMPDTSIGDRLKQVLGTPEGAGAFAGLPPSVQSGYKAAEELTRGYQLPTDVTEADRPRLELESGRGTPGAKELLASLDKQAKEAKKKGLEDRTTDPAFWSAYYDMLDAELLKGTPEEKARELARRSGARTAEEKRMERTKILSGATEGRYNISARSALAEEIEALTDQIAIADGDEPELPIWKARLEALQKRLDAFPLPSPIEAPPPPKTGKGKKPPTPEEAAAELARRRAAKKGK